MADSKSTPPNDQPREGRLVTEGSGHMGVSDARRAQLERMEQAAGAAEDATTGQRSTPGVERHAQATPNTTPSSAEQVGNQTEPENSDVNRY